MGPLELFHRTLKSGAAGHHSVILPALPHPALGVKGPPGPPLVMGQLTIPLRRGNNREKTQHFLDPLCHYSFQKNGLQPLWQGQELRLGKLPGTLGPVSGVSVLIPPTQVSPAEVTGLQEGELHGVWIEQPPCDVRVGKEGGGRARTLGEDPAALPPAWSQASMCCGWNSVAGTHSDKADGTL